MAQITQQRFEKIIDISFIICAFLLVVGIPLIFTSLTRSVFEVNKLLWLRMLTIITMGIWLFKYLVYQRNNIIDSTPENTITTRFFSWKKMGLEIPLLAWFVLNIISTIFSQNVRISIIGAYDRWEGIITVINYILLIIMITKTISKRYQMNWLIAGIIGSTALSSMYGVFQSLGSDFMNWSQDPTFRVFACINNPVHFCAYVAMVVPLSLGTLLMFSHRHTEEPVSEKPKMFSIFNISILVVALVLLKAFAFVSDDWTVFGLATLLTAVTWLVCLFSTSSIPTKKEAAYWVVFLGAFLVGILFNIFDFSRDQWFGYGISFMSFFTLTACDKQVMFKRFLFSLTILIFYTQVLSFSRATWVGFLMSMPFFYVLITRRFSNQSSRTYIADVTATAIGLFSFTLIQTFQVFSSNFLAGVLFSIGCAVAFLYSFFLIRNDEGDTFRIKDCLQTLIAIAILIILSCNLLGLAGNALSERAMEIIPYFLLAFFVFFSTTLQGSYGRFIERFILMVFFSHVQLTGKSFFDLVMHLSLALSYYLIALKGPRKINRETKFWLMLFAIMSGIFVLLPAVSSILDQFAEFLFANAFYVTLMAILSLLVYGLLLVYLIWGRRLLTNKKFQVSYAAFSLCVIGVVLVFHLKVNRERIHEMETSKGLAVAGTIRQRSQAYGGQFEHSARMSMWKSAIPWTKDYFLIGSGLDTVKFMYPVYRRPEYGILEGGHNFTPDRLHNEYLNTLVTRGGIGFLIYYGGIILTWLGLMLAWLYKNPNNPYRFIAIGASIGGCIYLGQVLFNFGVVATLVMFYVLMGISLAVRMHAEFQDEQEA